MSFTAWAGFGKVSAGGATVGEAGYKPALQLRLLPVFVRVFRGFRGNNIWLQLAPSHVGGYSFERASAS